MNYPSKYLLLIQNQETYDAIINWQPKNGEFIHPELNRIYKQTFQSSDLNAFGIPKTNVSTSGGTTTVKSSYNPQPVQLTNGDGVTLVNKWVLNMREAGKWLEFWRRNKDNGGLVIDPNGKPRSLSLSDTSDICILDETFFDKIQSALPITDPEA